MSSIFDTIRAEAQKVAQATVAQASQLQGFAARSALTQPTDGFTLPPTADGKVFYGYQLAAVQTAILFRRSVVGFAPGMGKTMVALAVANHVATVEGGRTVVVCPPSLRFDPWEREVRAQYPHLQVEVLNASAEATIPTADVLIVPDSVTLTRRLNDILAWGPTALVVDEAQRIKSRTAKRSKAVWALADALPADGIVLPLSGTIAKTAADDVWSTWRALGPAALRALAGATSYSAFQSRWCITQWNPWANKQDTIGIRDEAELHLGLRATGYVRVERAEVLDMPAKVWVERDLELNGDLREYRRMERGFLAWVAEAQGDDALKRASKAEAITKLNLLWKEAGKAKAAASAEYVQALVDAGEQVVVMGWHKSAIANFTRHLAANGTTVVQVVGGMTPQAKVDAQDAFRAGDAQVLVANIISGGTGLNLEVAAHLVFLQTCWSPGDIIQASDRIYRVTQRRDCTVHVLNASGTVDDRLWNVLKFRADLLDAVNSGRADVTISTGSVEEAVLADYGW